MKKKKSSNFNWILATKAQRERKLKAMFGTIDWSKSGGYADKRIEGFLVKLDEHGFLPLPIELASASPDGSWVSRGDYYIDKNGNIAILSKYYGSHRYDNSFSFRIIPVGAWMPSLK